MAINSFTIYYLGIVPIQIWGFFVALGMILTVLIIWQRGKRLGFDIEQVLNLVIYMIVGGFIGGRLFHVIFYEPSYYLHNILESFKIWQGGMSSFGGLAGAVVSAYFFIRIKKLFSGKLLSVFDLISFAALYGWILGRVGCLLTHLHLGRLSNLPFLTVQTTDGVRLEMAGLEIVGLLPLVLFFFLQRGKKLKKGYFVALLFIYYGILRFILDFFRATDIATADARYWGLTPAQFFGILIAVIGIYILKRKVRIAV